MQDASAEQPQGGPAPRQLRLTVWCSRSEEFAARIELADGTLRDFDSPFELLRFLVAPPPWPGGGSGLR